MRSRLIDQGNTWVTITPASKVVDRDGNEIMRPDPTLTYKRKGTVAEDRQSDAELPGQVVNKVVRVVVRDAPGLDSWAEIWIRGEQYDLAQPPHFSDGVSRAVKHVEMLLRSRNSIPTGGD